MRAPNYRGRRGRRRLPTRTWGRRRQVGGGSGWRRGPHYHPPSWLPCFQF
ncbi:unnamed protein product [Spirodela intermedia]|uniref:Uncharacterized protein n=1 Tax=Spirodela intermedia TaxID=51605 RepID=A0A7I8K0V5_SPIIN|nr:unnamed protein product [Spirodela intermedia]